MGALSFPIEFLSGNGGVTEAALAAIDAWDPTDITASTYSAVAGESRVFTHATGCDVTLPTGAPNGMMIAVRTGHATGYVKFVTGGGSSKVQSGTTQISGAVGKVMVAQATENANEWNITGHDSSAPRFLDYYADYPAVISAFPVNGGTITALGVADFLWCTPYGQRFVPNVAKTRMIAESKRINLIELGGTTANPIVAAITGTGLVTFSGGLPTLPAYLAQTGDFFEIEMLARHTGTAAGTELQLKLGTANSASDQTIAKITTSSANNQDGFGIQRVYVYSQTTVGATQLTLPNSSSSATQNTPTPLDFNALQYFNVNTQSLTAPDTLLLTQLRVTLVQKK